MKKFILGLITGGILTAAVTGFAVEYAITANPYPVKVNGVETTIQGYNINDETYFKLRDVSAAVGGFEVGFEDNAIVVNTPNKPAPSPTSEPTASTDITIVEDEYGFTYTSDGLWVRYEDNIPYVKEGEIIQKFKKKGFLDYDFIGDSLVNTTEHKEVITSIPHGKVVDEIPLDYYISTLLPFINNLSAE